MTGINCPGLFLFQLNMYTLILDLDHTIFDPRSIPPKDIQVWMDIFLELVPPSLKEQAFDDLYLISTTAFLDKYGIPLEVIKGQLEAREIHFQFSIEPFEDYAYLRSLPYSKILLTSGPTCMQLAKIEQLGIRDDFERIEINDPFDGIANGKFKILEKLINKSAIQLNNSIIIGDNYQEEITAGQLLGIRSILIDREGKYRNQWDCEYIQSFTELVLV